MNIVNNSTLVDSDVVDNSNATSPSTENTTIVDSALDNSNVVDNGGASDSDTKGTESSGNEYV